MEYTRIIDKNSILNLIKEFLTIFPHLEEKIVSLDEYAQKLSKLSYVYTAKEKGVSIGILVFYANDKKNKTAYISLIGVQNGYARMGIGKKLLEICEKISSENGMTTVKLEVDEDNINAIKFYEQNGFAFINKTECSSFYMEKELST